MKTEKLIPVEEFCYHHNIEVSFVKSLEKKGLIEITYISETMFISGTQLQLLEKFVRFHYEWDINMEGLETITQLLNNILRLQSEVNTLRNQLLLYNPEK